MKLYANQINELIKKIASQEIKTILMYGPNIGLINTNIDNIAKNLNLSITKINYKNSSINEISIAANTKNFFAQKEIIKIDGLPTALTKEYKQLFEDDNFHLLFFAQEETPSPSIRKYFEDNDKLAIIPCYFDNEQTIAKLILGLCKQNDKVIDEEALFYLKSHLKGDHQIILSELGKLFSYTHNKRQISKSDILETLSHDLMASGDEMCVYFSKKEALKFLKEIDKLKQQNINEVLMIRALIRYYYNVYTATKLMENGMDINSAVKSIIPPIFFKYVDDFKLALRTYSSTDAIKCIKLLNTAEANYKDNPSCFDMFSVYINIHNFSHD